MRFETFLGLLASLGAVLLSALAIWLDYHAWDVSHPGAPFWTYFFK